jgi:hypothetical protein
VRQHGARKRPGTSPAAAVGGVKQLGDASHVGLLIIDYPIIDYPLYEIHSPGSIRTKIVRKMSLMHVNGAWTKAGPCYPVARALWHNDSSSISYVARLLLCTEKFSKSFIKSLRHTIVVPLFTSV